MRQQEFMLCSNCGKLLIEYYELQRHNKVKRPKDKNIVAPWLGA